VSEIFFQYIINGLTFGAIYALIALGFTVIYKTTDIINFAQGEFVMLGGMLMYTFAENCSMPILPSFALTAVSVCFIGIITERLFIRPALNASLISVIIITIGISILYQSAAMLIWGKEALIIRPFSETEFIELSEEIILNVQNVWIFGITIFFMIILHLFFEKTITGKAFAACSSNPNAAALVGINRNKMVLTSFAVSAGLAGIAGAALCPLTNASYNMGTLFGLKGFCAAIIGGLGNNLGSILGGFMLGIIQELGAGFISSGYKDAISFLILIIFLVFKPWGLLGIKWKKRV